MDEQHQFDFRNAIEMFRNADIPESIQLALCLLTGQFLTRSRSQFFRLEAIERLQFIY